MMEDSSHLYISELGDREDTHEQDISWEHIYSHKLPIEATDQDALVCQHCNRCFTCKQGLERHRHIHHPCKSLENISTTSTDKRHQECRTHDNQLQPATKENAELSHEEITQELLSESFQEQTQTKKTVSTAVLEDNGEQEEQYMLDVSSDISENLSFYIDGKILSTSTVNNCEMEICSGSSTLVGLDALIVSPAQISQVLNTDSEIPGQQQSKRRTATPPLLPEIKTELQSEVVVSSSSSSLLSSLIENLFPQNTESAIIQEEHTVFLSPKLKQLLEKQEGFKPTMALITDGQKPSSPVSLSVLPCGTGKFRRRTGSPTGSPQQIQAANEDKGEPDPLDLGDGSKRQIEVHCNTPVQQTGTENDDATQSVTVPEGSPVLSESWAPATGGNPCNQQPLDLSNTVKRNEDVASADAALDLSLQRKSPGEPEPMFKDSNSNMGENVLIKSEDQKISPLNPKTPVVTDLTLVTGSDVVSPLENVAEGLVYGLTLPPNSLTSSTLTPLEQSASCAIAFASPVTHTVLPSAPSLITVLAPPPSISSSSNQPIQVLAPNLSPEPLVICGENALNSSQCGLASAFASANSANIVTLSQPLDPTLNLPSHMFLTDQISLNPPMVESVPVSEVPFPSTVTLNDSLLNIAGNTVLIECTIALESSGGVVTTAVNLQKNSAEPLTPNQMVINHIEQQQFASLPDPQTVDPAVLVSSIAESVTLTPNTPLASDSPPVADSRPGPEPVVGPELPMKKVEELSDKNLSLSETSPEGSPSPPPDKAEEEPANDIAVDAEEQTFTKNFICNVCDKLFHSMKELGHHVSEHADDWPYKCEFCVLLFGKPSALLDHRSNLHGVGKTYVCSACTKDFVYLCNLKQHQNELHPGQQCSYTEEEKGKLRPQNYNNTIKITDSSVTKSPEESIKSVKKEECEVDMAADELFTTIKIMTSDGGKIKGPDVRLGINQHYPSFKPPPFPYHNRSPAGSLASATNFTTHNIPQTFSTAIRCTKCGKSFDNMPELHKHILACANASDKKRYTPRKNPVPLRHFAKTQNGVLSTTNSANGLNTSVRVSQANRSKPSQDPPVKIKILKRKKKFVQRIMPHRNKSISSANKLSPAQVDILVCPHCSREFTMRRSRTKHMAVCPKKPKEMKKRKEGGISLTKENNEHSHRGVSHLKEKLQALPRHNTRLQTSGSTKRPAILPVQTVFSNKRSKIIIKESLQPKPEAPTLAEVPIRTFNPSMRQYSRVQHSIKGIPIKITIVKPPQSVPQKDESAASYIQEVVPGTINGSSQKKTSA